MLAPRTKRPKSTYVPPRELERLYKRAYSGDAVPKDLDISTTPETDPWSESQPDRNPNTSFLNLQKAVRAPSTLSRPPASLLASSRSASSIPKPNPANSYNPAFAEWDAILQAEGAKAIAAERVRLAKEAAEAEEQARIAVAAAEPDIDPLLLDEADEGLSAWEGFSSAWDTETEVTKKRPERKTRADRNKVKRRKAEEREAKHRSEMKKRDEQAARVRQIAAEVQAGEEARKKGIVSQEVVASTDNDLELQPLDDADSETDAPLRHSTRKGPRALPPSNLELLLPDELVDSLRKLKPEGNLLRDRFRSLQVRGKIEVRKPIRQAKKPKRTVTEKWSYKDWELVH